VRCRYRDTHGVTWIVQRVGAEQVRDLLTKLRTSVACQQRDRNTLQHGRVTGDGL
jgi:hypothetical protein